MAKQRNTAQKPKLGRPLGVKYGGTIPARFEFAALDALDAWAEKHELSRSEAIRRLVEIGLKAKAK